MSDPIRVLSLQPYYGGSHRQFSDGWASHSRFQWTTLSLPPRHWKWRMRHAGMYFADEIGNRIRDGEDWDVIFCSDMMNVAEFKGLLPEHATRIPIVLYFHENQFAYPNQFEQERDYHFAFTNFVSALAADQIWYNSQFNLDSMFGELEAQARNWPDFIPLDAIASFRSRASVQVPGIDPPAILLTECQFTRRQNLKQGKPLHLVWAARWEHDKNPQGLLDCLTELENRQQPFRVSVIGQSFREIPPSLQTIRNRFEKRINNWGYQQSRTDYWRALAEADVFLSTAHHEFFGLAAAEAIVCGLYPLLPNGLAYPELVGLVSSDDQRAHYLYDGTTADLVDRICDLIRKRDTGKWVGSTELAQPLTSCLVWENRAPRLDEALANAIEECDS